MGESMIDDVSHDKGTYHRIRIKFEKLVEDFRGREKRT